MGNLSMDMTIEHGLQQPADDMLLWSTDDYLDYQIEYESNARTYPRKIPLVFKKAVGSWLEDQNGKKYLDCLCNAGTFNLGHSHPVLVETLKQVIDQQYPWSTLDLLTDIKAKFMHTLLSSLPEDMKGNYKIQFCGPTGSDAIEAAIKLVKTYTGKKTCISFHGAYHGMGMGSLSLTGQVAPKESLHSMMGDVQFFPYPYEYRCPFGVGGEMTEKLSAHYLHHVLKDPESGLAGVAGVFVEPIQGEGGVIPAPLTWMKKLREITKECGIPLVVDEIQCGIGRTGSLFAFVEAGIMPDVIVCSKAIGGGLPLSLIMYHKNLDVWKPGAHAGTFRGNQMAMALGTKVLELVNDSHFLGQVREKGQWLYDIFCGLQEHYSFLGDVRGRGLMLGIEVVNPQGEKDSLQRGLADQRKARSIQQACLKEGLLLELGGRHGHVLRFLPPLNISWMELQILKERFTTALNHV